MPIMRIAERTDPYYRTPRSTSQDTRLTYEAVGLLAYLLSKPDGWEVRIEDLMARGTDREIGRDKVYRIINELKSQGYISRKQYRDGNGTWLTAPYLVYETPFSPLPCLPESVKPEVIEMTEA